MCLVLGLFLDKMPWWDVFCLLCLQKLWAQQACVDEGIISVWRSGAHAVHSQDVVLSSDLGLCFRSNLQCNEASSAYGPLPLCPCGAGWSTSAGCRAVPRSTRSSNTAVFLAELLETDLIEIALHVGSWSWYWLKFSKHRVLNMIPQAFYVMSMTFSGCW